jgi:hypothetical protein
MQRERRRDPYPWTWEPAALAAALVGLGFVLAAQVGRSAANLLAGAGWTWPDTHTVGAGTGTTTGTGLAVPSPLGAAFWRSLPAVLGGDAGAGLPAPVPADLAGPGLVRLSVTVTEVAILAALASLTIAVYLRWGPGRLRGMATPAEAERLLGLTRIRKVAAVVRPDLYGGQATGHHRVPPAGDPVWPDLELGRRLNAAFPPRPPRLPRRSRR